MKLRVADKWQIWQWTAGDGMLRQVTAVPGNVVQYEWIADQPKLFLEVESTGLQREPSAERGILYNGEFRPWESVPLVESIRRAAPSTSEYWTYSFRTRKAQRATAAEIEMLRPLTTSQSTDAQERKISIPGSIIGDAKHSPVSPLVAYLYTTTDPAVSALTTQGIVIQEPDTGRHISVTKGTSYIDRWWWSADGATVYYNELRGNGRSNALVAASALDGSTAPVFAGPAGQYFSDFSVTRDGKLIACLREDNTHPPSIALVQRRTGEFRTLVELNPEFRTFTLSIPSRIEGVNSYGEPWFAYLIKPVNYSRGKNYPLIVTTYRSGDYFLEGASGDENPIQVYAANGFVVLCFDVGRPRNIKKGDFADKLRDWASPTASIEAAMKELIANGLVDPGRVGIEGFSHGEEIVAYALTHTTLFHAVVGGSGYDPYFYDLGGNAWRRHFRDWGLEGWAVNEARTKWSEIAVSLRADRVLCPILENVPESEYLTKLSTLAALGDLGKAVRDAHLPGRSACQESAQKQIRSVAAKSRLVPLLAAGRREFRSRQRG